MTCFINVFSKVDFFNFTEILNMSELETIVLAFDIEKAGAKTEHPVIAIGASVMNESFKELDSLLIPLYRGDPKVFEDRCYNEFWCHHLDKLPTFTYKGELNEEHMFIDAIYKFQEFRAKWEKECRENSKELLLISDNMIFDGGCINELISRYAPDEFPLPYSTDGVYSDFKDIGDVECGLLTGVILQNPELKINGKKTEMIHRLFGAPEPPKEHDHLPNNDANFIAFRYQVFRNVQKKNLQIHH